MRLANKCLYSGYLQREDVLKVRPRGQRREAGAGNEVCIANDPADLGPVDTGEGGDNGANCEEQRRCRNFKPSHSLQLVHM